MSEAPNAVERAAIDDYLANPTAESYQTLFRLMSPQIFSYFRFLGCDPSLGEDLAQEVMATVFTESCRLRDPELFRAWLFRIARNQWLQHLRTQQRRVPTTALDAESDRVSTADCDLLAELVFAEWLAALRPDERRVVLLRFVEGREHHEIADMLDMAMGTVQWKVFRVRRSLVQRLGLNLREKN